MMASFRATSPLCCWRNFIFGLVPVLLFVAHITYGDILDLTLVTNHPLLDLVNQDDHVISAYIGDRHASIRDSITFERIENGTALNEYTMEDNEGDNIRRLYFNNTAGIKGVGTFRAVAEFEGVTYTTSTAVLLHNATIKPKDRTLTAYVGEDVNITVITDLNKASLRWRFNGTAIKDARGDANLGFLAETSFQAGVYQCFENGRRGDSEHAYMLLHIRRCPAGRWGPSCDQTCTECLNGGKCDAGSGECVCPPGFKGSTCEQALGSNRFGQNGSFSCEPSGNDHGPGCRGKLFCLPDPFGCTCAAGYMGLNCTTECSPGTYGANCLQVCHCYGNNCAPDTGTCINGAICQDGWTGVNCQDAAFSATSLGSSVISSTATEIRHGTTPVTTHATTFSTPSSTPTYEIESFNYNKVNNGEPTRLVCEMRGSPPLPSASISVVNALGGDDGIGFLGTTSSSSSRTSWYQVQVGLDDGARNFRCILHRPDGSNVSSDLAVSVYEPPSFNVFNSLIQDITFHSITLRWNAWAEGRDYGDGPVIGYRVYLSVHEQDSFIPTSNDLITNLSFTIHNLTRDTLYDIKVAAVRPGPSGEGTYAPASSHRTLCSAPSEPPVFSVQRREQSSVTLGWELISNESWGCSALSGIEITVDSTVALFGFPQTLVFSAEDRTATIRDLQDCTHYRISAAFRNKDELGISSDPISLSTSLIRPASVQSLQMSPFKTLIKVNWELPSNRCSPEYYIIRYGLYQKTACSSPEPTLTLTEIKVIGPTERYNIVGLDPYSRYKVAVIAVNGAGQSEETTGFADTLPGQPSIITNVTVDQERTSATSIGFTWQPLTCRNVNGVFWYYYARIYRDGYTNFRAVGSKYLDDDISYSSVEFEDLEPCTMYEFKIHAANRDVSNTGSVSFANGVTRSMFFSANAHAVSDQPVLDFHWSVPSQCAVKVDYYKLSYQLISRQACPDVPVIDATVYHLNTTSSAIQVVQRITSLEYYATYNVSIKAVIGEKESPPRFVTESTSEGVPSPIQSVSYTSTTESLHFIWEEPSCENLLGELDDYDYDLYNLDEGFHVRSSSTLRNDVVMHDLDACTQYRFRVRVVMTSSRRSERVIVLAMTNISAPGAPDITQLTQYQYGIGNTGLTVTWQPPTSPRCQPSNYEIKYYLRRGDMCEPIQSDPQMKLAGAVNGSTFTYDIKELRAYSEYQVFVRGNTTSGYGDSDSMAETTGYSYPTGPPTNIHSTSIRKRSIVFTWEKPECGYRNGPITSYTVMLTDSKGVVVHNNNVSDSEAVGYEIFSLTPYFNYIISIRAWNYELLGEFGPEVWEQTAEARPAAPEQVTIPSSDQESITVEWVSPDPPEGRIIRYYILYWETDDADATPSNVSIPCLGDQCSDLEYKFSGRIPNLKSDTNYSVQVQAESIRGVGPKSPHPAIVGITSKDIPSDPQEVTITRSTETSLTITWAKPKYPRGRIISYKLAYKVKGKPYDSTFQPGEDFTMKQLDGDTTRFVLSDLVPATHYEVYVVASTSKGEGESSEHVLEFTAPPPVEDLPKPSPPVIVMSPEGTPMIQFSDMPESPYITHMLVAVEERLPVARRRRQQSEYGSYSETPSAYIAASISKDDLPIEFTIGDNETYGIYHNAPLKDKAIYGIRIGVQSNVGGLKCTLFGDSSEFKTGENDVTSTPLGAVIGGTLVPLMIALLSMISALCYRRTKQRRGSGPKTSSKAIPTYENPAFDKSNAQPHTYQAFNADDAHIYQSVASYVDTNQDTSPKIHTGQDPTPDTHTYLDPSLYTNINLDLTNDTHTDLDPATDTDNYLHPFTDTHVYSACLEECADTYDYIDPKTDIDTGLETTLDTNTYSNINVLQ